MTDQEHQEPQPAGAPGGEAALPREQVFTEDVTDLDEYDPDADEEHGHAEDDGQ